MSETPPTPNLPPPSPFPLNYQSNNPLHQLHNTTAAAWLSALFSPAFGAWLVARNWKTLGFPDKARHNLYFAWAILLFFIAMPPLVLFVPAIDAIFDKIPSACSIGLLLGWYYGLAKPQKIYIQEKFGPTYPRRSWLIPLTVAIACTISFLIYVVALAFLSQYLYPSTP